MNPQTASATPLAPTGHDVFTPQYLLAQLSELIQDGPAYLKRSARSLHERLRSEWSLDAEPTLEEANPEEEEEPL